MECSMSVNDILPDDITRITDSLIPSGFQSDVRCSYRTMQEQLSKLIDAIGEQSAAAQGLNRVITTAEKLRNSCTHTVYLLKDPTAKNGQGEVIGLLKVGYKHLFLFDERDQVHEVEPLCVLDFYVVRDRQRSGYGRVLFDYMLHDMETTADQLPIDGPSPKMEQFLAKNYDVDRLLRQNNNFAVPPQFFDRLKSSEDTSGNKSGRSTPAAAAAAVGRFAAPKPPSAIASVIHGGASYYAETNNGPARGGDLYKSRHTNAIWRHVVVRHGDSSDRELDRSEQSSPTPQSEDERLPEPLPWAQDTAQNWDDDDHYEQTAAGRAASPARPETLNVAPPAAPAAFADVPAAGLPSGSATPAAGLPSGATTPAAGAGARRDSQLTDKGYFDVKFYHNKLW